MSKPMRRQVVVELDGKQIQRTTEQPVRSGRRGAVSDKFPAETAPQSTQSEETQKTQETEKAAPWSRNADLPAPVRKLPGAAQTTWRAVAVESLKTGSTLDKAEEVAWNTINRLYRKVDDGTWTLKREDDAFLRLSRFPGRFLKMAFELVKEQAEEEDEEEDEEKAAFTSSDLGQGTSTGSKKPRTKEPKKPKRPIPVVHKEDEQIELVTDMSKAATDIENRYTFAPIYAPNIKDAHDEFVEAPTLEKAVWGYVQRDDRTLYLQHQQGERAGEWVNIVTWPFDVETEITLPTGEITKVSFPAGTSFMGVLWDENVWPLVKKGEIRGYSLGGRAQVVEVDE